MFLNAHISTEDTIMYRVQNAYRKITMQHFLFNKAKAKANVKLM